MKRELKKWVALGKVGRAKGLRGEFRLTLFNPLSEVLSQVEEVGIGNSEEDLHVFQMDRAQKEAKGWVILFKEIGSQPEASLLTGKTLYVLRENLPALKKGEYYHHDLLGLLVETDKGVSLGFLKQILTTSSNEVYVVKSESGETLLPVIPGVIVRVDLNQEKIVVSPPEAVDAF